jgi:hypothetical protein
LSSAAGLQLDHAFIGCPAGAPAAAALLKLGFVEGSGNTHPGQGTANRRFFFENFMLELLWVADAAEVQNDRTRRTRLWDRCERQDARVSPFGIVFGAPATPPPAAPFPIWEYRPGYLPDGLAMQIADGTTLYEPELFYLPFLRRAGPRKEPVVHAAPIRRIQGVSVGVCNRGQLSAASRSAEEHGLVSYFESALPVLEIRFTGPADLRIEVRPDLPLVFRGAPD